LSTTDPTWIDLGTNPGFCGERPATNCLNRGTANFWVTVSVSFQGKCPDRYLPLQSVLCNQWFWHPLPVPVGEHESLWTKAAELDVC
jgi:hypothetical protein